MLPRHSMARSATIPVEAIEAAKAARLRYADDTRAGITRRRAGAGFSYRRPGGAALRDRIELRRIRRLAIPPAWTDVWISPDPRGHLQATGRDARGRKQYRYHDRWKETRDETKYARLAEFARALPKLRARTDADLRRSGLPRERILATVVRLLEATLIRVGNDEYARDNGSFGLTTMRGRHVDVSGSRIAFRFRGKGGIQHEVDLTDRRLARVVARLQELPGQDLFQYLNGDGEARTVTSDDVNDYLREITGEDFTAKDFRTWAGTVLAARALLDLGPPRNGRAATRNVNAAIDRVAHRLGNTRAVCRRCYVHPAIVDGYVDRSLFDGRRPRVTRPRRSSGLAADERQVLALLHRQAPRAHAA